MQRQKGGKNKSTRDKSSGKGRNSPNSFEHEVIGNNSEITIYERAVKDSEQLKAQQVKRISSLSEENENCSDTSDELLEVAIEEGNGNEMTEANNFGKLPNQTTNNQMLNNDSIVAGTFRQGNQIYVDDGQRPSTSHENAPTQRAMEEPEEVAERIIREAELSKALVYDTPGKDDKKLLPLNMISDYVQDAIADEHYKIIGVHIDQTTKTKILNNEYVDFTKLLPRDRVSQEEDGRVQMIFKNGIPFYIPVNDYQQISSFSRWEQAFRVFSAIYTKEHPHRANELLQYGHIIQTASLTNQWDNVYLYNKDFRIHISEFPNRSWGTILQLAWNLCLKDKSPRVSPVEQQRDRQNKWVNREICRQFNRGWYSYGFRCKYEHRCTYCNKLGHGSYNCRKVDYDRHDRGDRGTRSYDRDRNNDNWRTPEKRDGKRDFKK